MPRRSTKDELPIYKRFASAFLFICGLASVFLYVYGPTADGRSEVLLSFGIGLVAVSIAVFFAVNFPAVDLSTVLVRILSGVLSALEKEDKGTDANGR